MDALQKTQLRLSEVRRKLGDIGRKDEPTGEDLELMQSLGKEYDDLEVRSQALLRADVDRRQIVDQGDAQGREMRSLVGRASIGEMMKRIADDVQYDGPEKEVAAELGDGRAIPFEMLDTTETRADASTTTTVSDGPQRQRQGVLGRVFAGSISSFLGVSPVRVEPGRVEFTVVTSGASPASVAEDASAGDAVALGVRQIVLKPKRLAVARYRATSEFYASQPGAEMALRDDLRNALMEAVDAQAINGDGSGANGTGFLTRIAAPATAPAKAPTSDDFLSFMAGAINGREARTESDIRGVFGVKTYRLLASILISDSSDTAVIQSVKQRFAGVQATPHLAEASNVEPALTYSMRGASASIAASWGGVNIIRDQYTGAGSGQVVLTASVLMDLYCAFRPNNYTRGAFKTS